MMVRVRPLQLPQLPYPNHPPPPPPHLPGTPRTCLRPPRRAARLTFPYVTTHGSLTWTLPIDAVN